MIHVTASTFPTGNITKGFFAFLKGSVSSLKVGHSQLGNGFDGVKVEPGCKPRQLALGIIHLTTETNGKEAKRP